jgi:predicted PurR-regulated permease PerM
MINNASQLITKLIARGQEWTNSIRDKFPDDMKQNADKIFQQIGAAIGNSLASGFNNAGSFANYITGSLGFIFAFSALPLFLFFLLKDYEKIPVAIYRELPPDIARHARAVVQIIEKVLGRYIRSELILGTIVGSMTLVGLLIIRAPFAVPLAFFNGVCEIVPTVGPIAGGVVMGLAMLALAPDKVIWAVGLAIMVQLLENNLLVPRIQAGVMHMHPSVTIMLLVLGGYFWGLWGIFFTVPVAATLVEIFQYVRKINTEANQKLDEKPAG